MNAIRYHAHPFPTGPTLELMFRSCQPPPGEGGAAAQGQRPQGEEGGCGADVGPAVAQGSRRSWWGRPVVAQVQGSYSIAPLEDHSLEGSPESLVTCIIKVGAAGHGLVASMRAAGREGRVWRPSAGCRVWPLMRALSRLRAWEEVRLASPTRPVRKCREVPVCTTNSMKGSLDSGINPGR